MSSNTANIGFAYCDFLDFVITDSIAPDLRAKLVRIQNCHRRAIRASARPGNIRRASHHLQEAIRRFRRVRHRVSILPAEAFARPAVAFHEPSYTPIQ